MTAAVAATVIGCGGVAAVVRYLLAVWFSPDGRFPWAVLTVNVAGSALAGTVLGLASGLGDDVTVILLSGVAGGLTTFSTFSVETVQLVVDGRTRTAALNVGLNLGAGLAATVVAYAIAVTAFG